MKLIKEIKRRARNVLDALRGEEPVRRSINVVHETLLTRDFQVEQILSPRGSVPVPLEIIENEMARELGRSLLEAGAIVVDVNGLREEPGERVSLRVRVVMPANQTGRPTRTEREAQP